jgi:predicted branched-subunit amino acid permease
LKRSRGARRKLRPSRGDAPAGEREAIIADAVAIGLASGGYALSFGALSVTAGLSIAQTTALSLLMFTGASQFAFVASLTGGGSPWAAAATAALLGSRNAFYGLRLSSVLPTARRRRMCAAQLVIDESTAMAVSRDAPEEARLAFWTTGLAVFILWNLGTLAGAIAAHALSNPRTLGLDAAAPAAFVALLAPRMTSRSTRALAAGCAAIALLSASFVPTGVPVLLAAAAVMVAGSLRPSAAPDDGER